jgi:hypothetical protein
MTARWTAASVVFVILALTTATGGRAAAVGASAVDIGSRRELFVDRFLVDTMSGCALALQTPRPSDIAVKSDRPWEGWYSFAYTTVLESTTRRPRPAA